MVVTQQRSCELFIKKVIIIIRKLDCLAQSSLDPKGKSTETPVRVNEEFDVKFL